MFYEPSTSKTYTHIEAFKQAYLHTSFGDLNTKNDQESAGIFLVKEEPPPIDSELESLSLGAIVKVGEQYVQSYTIVKRELSEAALKAILLARFDTALNAFFDSVAKSKHYDTRYTCALRAGYPGPFQAEGLAFASWMDSCNAIAYNYLSQVNANLIDIPSNPQALLDMMPEISWPN